MLVLAEGDIVPADAQVTEAAALLVDESALTSESAWWWRPFPSRCPPWSPWRWPWASGG